MTELSHGQIIALNHHLNKYPHDLSFKEICDLFEEGSNEIDIHAEFTMWDTEYTIEKMSNLANHIDAVIVDSHKEPEDDRKESNNVSSTMPREGTPNCS